jgi:hypothetical protein
MVAFRGIRITAAISDPRARQEVPSGTASKRQVSGKPNPKPQVQSGLALKQHMPNRTDSKHQVPSGPLSIDRELGHGLVVSVGYLFASAHNLVRAENLNVCPQAGTTNSATSCPAAGPPLKLAFPDGQSGGGALYTNSGLLYYTDNSGNSVYNGGIVQASGHFGQYLHFNANYTYSKTLDDGTFTTFVSTPQDFYDRPLERANSNQDIRNRFIANFTADGPAKTLLRNFELSRIVTA